MSRYYLDTVFFISFFHASILGKKDFPVKCFLNQTNFDYKKPGTVLASVRMLFYYLFVFIYSILHALFFCPSIKTSQGSKTQITKNTDFADILIF